MTEITFGLVIGVASGALLAWAAVWGIAYAISRAYFSVRLRYEFNLRLMNAFVEQQQPLFKEGQNGTTETG